MQKMFLALTAAVVFLQPCPAQQSASPETAHETTAAVDPKIHEYAVKLIELQGARQRLLDNVDKMVQDGRDAMTRMYPNADPQYIAEWGKRMKEKFRVEDYLGVFVKTY